MRHFLKTIRFPVCSLQSCLFCYHCFLKCEDRFLVVEFSPPSDYRPGVFPSWVKIVYKFWGPIYIFGEAHRIVAPNWRMKIYFVQLAVDHDSRSPVLHGEYNPSLILWPWVERHSWFCFLRLTRETSLEEMHRFGIADLVLMNNNIKKTGPIWTLLKSIVLCIGKPLAPPLGMVLYRTVGGSIHSVPISTTGKSISKCKKQCCSGYSQTCFWFRKLRYHADEISAC